MPTLLRVAKVFAIAALATVAMLFVAALTAGWLLFGEGRFMGTTFTPEAWAEAGSCVNLIETHLECRKEWGMCPRGAMVWSLTRNHLIVGKLKRDEAAKLLGPDFYDRMRNGQSCMIYNLGYCSGFGFDGDHLELCFDDSGLLTSSRHYQS
jgi:hypothetical protein